jgi:hypothetical protein
VTCTQLKGSVVLICIVIPISAGIAEQVRRLTMWPRQDCPDRYRHQAGIQTTYSACDLSQQTRRAGVDRTGLDQQRTIDLSIMGLPFVMSTPQRLRCDIMSLWPGCNTWTKFLCRCMQCVA